ncbi:PKD domain-containing protein [Nocardioides sp.]|jgi:5'-nucleotidase|uniref:PKD domain-containing protein n=1 Tax=Nocardioides sp. TaxID=35761 RepID=UPI002F429BCD
MLTGGIVLGLVVGAVGTTAAEAKPSKPGGVTGLAAQVTPGDLTYGVAATWNPVAKATSYRVAITRAGTTLASKTVTTPTWTPVLATTPGTVSLSVRAVIRHQPGKASTISVPLPDVTAPTGIYSSTWDNNTGIATLTQDSLTDDSPTSQVTRMVAWGDGTAAVAWTTGTTLKHTYPLTAARYVPTVTLNDAADNGIVVAVPAVVINDAETPTGTFTAGPASAWAGLTRVRVTQTALADNWSPADKITRSVDWGDGATTPWTSGTTLTHVYRTGGTFTPAVTATDEAGNAAILESSAVVVNVDSVAPVVKLLLPKRHRHSVRAWKTLHGTATDTAGTGVKRVRLRVVEKRGGHWYGYRPATNSWVKAASKAKAFARGRGFSLTTNPRHRWAATLSRLTKGTLVYRVSAIDRVGNTSKLVTHTARLTAR